MVKSSQLTYDTSNKDHHHWRAFCNFAETTVAQLSVDAAVEGDRRKALQCFLLYPLTTDIDVAKKTGYLSNQRQGIPVTILEITFALN